ncbi:MAG: DUF4876 domain-containing protein [candidate division KSB1 bacterium]|nr:DUF4876 domain-containing protein [candidate division KSB1 bacterium]MDZ7335364.1 DUF4876 domain-containing protein [candidate division KSB1 bacterium]MDZ7357684.1 DUF4876 domain-containing protein [candidate division KSB1 bacterium]MDZ7375733.1 DUF4876 domain-containing protein [candidate division KSB1 bacterium]MDZ7401523.1 DUF4876 domain-containing protein [candidate division KSB1 bacterium]
MKVILTTIIIGAMSIGTFYCSLDKPTAVDGTLAIKLMAIDTSGVILPGKAIPVPNATIYILSSEYNLFIQDKTDNHGYFELSHLLGTYYQIAAFKYIVRNLPHQTTTLLLTGTLRKDFSPKRPHRDLDTLKMGVMPAAGLVINEIYYTGAPQSNNYYHDQYIELYNASSQIQYLDGLFLCRISGEKNEGNQIVAIEYYRFPGSGSDFPVAPRQFIVVARDAINHVTEGGIQTSIDLSQANWEFYNKLTLDGDNPNVPNLENCAPARISEDFHINQSNDEVALIRVDDAEPVQYYVEKGKPTPYRIFRVDQVIDGVEYSADPSEEFKKAFDVRIDAGYAGLGIERYTGHSIERHHPLTGGPGFDTNNSSFDFKSLNRPTPGWQHGNADIYLPNGTVKLHRHFDKNKIYHIDVQYQQSQFDIASDHPFHNTKFKGINLVIK